MICNYKNYALFEEDKIKCRACSVGSVYNQVVLSVGCKTNPKIIVLGEAPGKDEVEAKEPFVGKAGKLLRSVLKDCGLRKSNTLISNIIPCRPENNKFPQDMQLVRECCNRWLSKEIELLKPDYLLLLGAQPLKYVLNMSGITAVRGKWFNVIETGRTIKCLPTFHPAYVLRKEYMEEGKIIKENFIDDIRTVARDAGLIK